MIGKVKVSGMSAEHQEAWRAGYAAAKEQAVEILRARTEGYERMSSVIRLQTFGDIKMAESTSCMHIIRAMEEEGR